MFFLSRSVKFWRVSQRPLSFYGKAIQIISCYHSIIPYPTNDVSKTRLNKPLNNTELDTARSNVLPTATSLFWHKACWKQRAVCVCVARVIAESCVHACKRAHVCVCSCHFLGGSQIGNNEAFSYSDTLFLTFRFVQDNKQIQLTDKTL